jgi:hypothetical protein
MSQHDPSHGSASGSARPGSASEGRARPDSSASGFDPVSLRTAVDVGAAEARLAALGQSRSTSALGERADLLRTLGRLDEALAIAEEAFRLAHFTGDRADSTAARIRRAHIFREQGKLERALNDLHTSRITASTEEWRDLETAAAELEGYTLFDLGRHDEAQEALQQAVVAFEATGAPRDRVEGLRRAIEGVLRAYLSGTGPVEPVSAAPAAPPANAPAAAAPVVAPAPAPGAVPASDLEARPGDTNPVDLSRPSDALVPTTAPADDERPAAVAPGSAPAGSWRPSQPAPAGDPQPELPPRADAGLWSKISGLAANASAHRERTERAERAARGDGRGDARADGSRDDEPRRGTTGVTGVVDELPRDDQPTTWPFPRR